LLLGIPRHCNSSVAFAADFRTPIDREESSFVGPRCAAASNGAGSSSFIHREPRCFGNSWITVCSIRGELHERTKQHGRSGTTDKANSNESDITGSRLGA
jgi:hypothetical protein